VRVDALMTSPVHTVRPEDTPKQVARCLVEHGWGCAPVVDATGALIGIVTEADLMRLELHRDPTRQKRRDRVEWTDPPPAEISEIMTTKVFAVPVDYDVADAARLMIERHLTRLPVVAGEQVVGIVSRTDLLRPLLRNDSAIAQEAALRLADVPGPWTAQVDGGVLALTGNGKRDTERLARTLAWGVSGVVGVHVTQRADNA
jgi:CBS domain-containing protein